MTAKVFFHKYYKSLIATFKDQHDWEISQFSANDMIDFSEEYTESLQPKWIKIESEDDLPKESGEYWD